VLPVVDDCIAKGVKGLVVISAGFSEIGPKGRALEGALVEKIRSAGIRLIGPNCMGIINTDPAVQLNATFSPITPQPGGVAMMTQSGALGVAILDYANQLNLGISSFVSAGNKADVSGNDLVQFWADDPRTSVILLYLESFGNPRKFSEIARRVARRKPIVVVKSGRSQAGARAASSHTGALATSDVIVDALFRQAGVIRTDTFEELFDVATLVDHGATGDLDRLRRATTLLGTFQTSDFRRRIGRAYIDDVGDRELRNALWQTLRRDLRPTVDQLKASAEPLLRDVLSLGDRENAYLATFYETRRFDPLPLFDGTGAAADLPRHPMAAWRLQQLERSRSSGEV